MSDPEQETLEAEFTVDQTDQQSFEIDGGEVEIETTTTTHSYEYSTTTESSYTTVTSTNDDYVQEETGQPQIEQSSTTSTDYLEETSTTSTTSASLDKPLSPILSRKSETVTETRKSVHQEELPKTRYSETRNSGSYHSSYETSERVSTGSSHYESKYSDHLDDSGDDRKTYVDYKKKESFEYDTYVDLVGEDTSFATAAQLSTLEKRNKVLLEAIDDLEEKLYESESKRLTVQRQLLIAEEVSADYRTLIDQRESQNHLIRKELDQLGVQYQNETSRFNEIDNERRKLEHKMALVQSEKDVNARSQAKLEQYLAEIENLKQKLTSMLVEKSELDQQVNQRQREVSDLEKRLHAESSRARDINKRTVENLENLIETERKRAQQAIDYVRQTLKAKIRVLEAQVEVDRSSDNSIKNDKRDIARQLKNAKRKLDEKKSDVGKDKRKIEALTKQVTALKERHRKLVLEISDLENEQHTLKRETSTLATQVEATQFSNAKLHVLVPMTVYTAIEEEASSKYPKQKEEPSVNQSTESTSKKRSEVRIPPRENYKPVEEKQESSQSFVVEDRLDSKDDLDFDRLEKDLESKVNIDGDDLGNLDDLVRETEGEQRLDLDSEIRIDDN